MHNIQTRVISISITTNTYHYFVLRRFRTLLQAILKCTQKMMAKDGHPPMLEGNLSAGKVSQQLRALVTLAERPIVQVLVYLSSSSQTIPFPGTRDETLSSGILLGHLHTRVWILTQLHTLTHK